MADTKLTLGFAAVVRPTFDTALAAEHTEQARAALVGAGFALVEAGMPVSTLEQAQAVARQFVDQPLDLLLVFQSSFADSSMIMALVEMIDAPLFLWAVPEAPTGGRLHLNALCGMTLAAHALTRAQKPYTTAYAFPADPTVLENVRAVAQAGHARRMLQTAKIGLVGEPPPGFASCVAHPDALKQQLGVEIVPITLAGVFERARAADPAAVETTYAAWGKQIDGLHDLDQPALRSTLASYLTLREMVEQHRLDGLSVRCWAHFVQELGCAVCGAQSMLTNELIPSSCEADVNGTVTQLILQWMSGEPAFDSDIVSFDMQANTAIFWHCGKAPLSMADPDIRPRGANHFNFKKPLVMEFPLKPGRVTFARLSEATGSFRLVFGGGEVIQAPISFSGTSGVVRFDSPAQQVLDTMLGQGLEHHLALVYGDYTGALDALAAMLGFSTLRL